MQELTDRGSSHPPSVCQSMALLKRLTRSSLCGMTLALMKLVSVKFVAQSATKFLSNHSPCE